MRGGHSPNQNFPSSESLKPMMPFTAGETEIKKQKKEIANLKHKLHAMQKLFDQMQKKISNGDVEYTPFGIMDYKSDCMKEYERFVLNTVEMPMKCSHTSK